MSNNPIETGTLKRYLKFVSLGREDLYEISEPPGSDASNFVVQQDENRFGRDVVYGSSKGNLMFYDVQIEKMQVEQVQTVTGDTSFYLDHGLNLIFETVKRFGYEGRIDFLLYKDGTFWTLGRLDIANPETDMLTYFGCKIVQNLNVELYKKNLDTTINLFSTRNLRNEPITPAPTLKVLRKATPITRTSKWVQKTAKTAQYGLANRFNFCRQIEVSDIQNTLTPFYDIPAGTYGECMTNFKYLTAVNTLTNGLLTINLNAIYKHRWSSGHGSGSTSILTLRGVVTTAPFTGIQSNTFTIYTHTETGTGDIDFTMPSQITYNLPVIPRGQSLFLMWDWTGHDGTLFGGTRIEIANSSMEVTATQTAVNAVINTVRYIDVLKQCSKFINNLPVNATIFDVDGEHYDNVCWNRSLISPQTSNSLTLLSATTPTGSEVGQVINNIDDSYLPKGYYFWNGSVWTLLDEDEINHITLTTSSTPAGTTGQLVFNDSTTVEPAGLCYWNGSNWQSLEYSQPMETSIKDAFSNSMTLEACADYELRDDRIDFAKYEDFYPNIEIGAFMIKPSRAFKPNFNERFKLNNYKMAYATFEQNRLSQNTSEDFHTANERNIPNLQVENKLELLIKYIRSNFSAQAIVDLETRTPQTADENDDKIFINKIVPLPAGSFNIEFATLLMRINDGNLEILNRAENTNENDVAINWLTLGTQVGDSFEILTGDNVEVYTIVSMTATNIVLSTTGTAPTFEGDSAISFKYYYTDVEWQVETNEFINVVSGLTAGNLYQNLNYTIGRNTQRWGRYLKTAVGFSTLPVIRNLKFINNPKLQTEEIATGNIIKETADIVIADMPIPILTPYTYQLEVKADFNEVLDTLNNYYATRGFVRCIHPDGRVIKGYFQVLDQNFRKSKLDYLIEEKYEEDDIILTYADGVLTVNDVPYNLSGISDWFKISDEYFDFYDKKAFKLCNTRHYSNIKLNGVVYDNEDDLLDALLAL